MRKYSKYIIAVCLCTFALTQEKVCSHLGFGQMKFHQSVGQDEQVLAFAEGGKQKALTLNDDIYRWDEQSMNWVLAEEENAIVHLVNYTSPEHASTEPIILDWKILMDIQYKSKFFAELDMEMYAPVYPEEVTALDKQEVIVEGFVIPLDEKNKTLALSYNPYASCFFCGKASPASVISLYLKNSKKRYKVDDFISFRGVLHLNHDDPNEFYYILRNAEEESE